MPEYKLILVRRLMTYIFKCGQSKKTETSTYLNNSSFWVTVCESREAWGVEVEKAFRIVDPEH